MIISDTNPLSSFAAAQSLSLLVKALDVEFIHLPPAVRDEISAGLERGYTHLSAVKDLISNGTLRVIELTDADKAQMTELPASFGPGEREAVALAHRLDATVLSNERRVVNYCARHGLTCFDLGALFRRLWVTKVATQAEVKAIMAHMTEVEGIVFVRQDEIFADSGE